MIRDFQNRITILSVEGRNDQKCVDGAARAILHSQKETGLENAVLCSARPPSKNLPVKWCRIKPINNVDEYSRWMLQESYRFFDTDHVLVVQRDGFVAHGNLWNDRFMDYDYIGAPWPIEVCTKSPYRVGNGGFSFRSRRLMRLISYFDESYVTTTPEDMLICGLLPLWESIGFKFAPTELAATFSVEMPCAEHKDLSKTFGFHARLTDVTKAYYDLITTPDETVCSGKSVPSAGTNDVARCLSRLYAAILKP